VPQQQFTDDFRRFFVRGLGALVPTLLTIAIIVWAFKLINEDVGVFITGGLLKLCTLISDEPAPGLLDMEHDPLRHGTPLNEYDSQGRRLTIEYKIIENYKVLLQKAKEAKAEHKKVPKEILRQAKIDRRNAVWRIAFAKYHLHLLGFASGIVLIYFVGFFLASFIGRTFWRAAEGLLKRIPIIRAIYPNVKQVTDFLLSERTVDFAGVVAVQYPRKGIWSLGLSTGAPMKHVQDSVQDELVTVFVPSSPTPVTGYVIQVPRNEVIELNMTIDEGLRFTISAGVIKPEAAGIPELTK